MLHNGKPSDLEAIQKAFLKDLKDERKITYNNYLEIGEEVDENGNNGRTGLIEVHNYIDDGTDGYTCNSQFAGEIAKELDIYQYNVLEKAIEYNTDDIESVVERYLNEILCETIEEYAKTF